MYSQIQSLLLKKLPRLGELKPWLKFRWKARLKEYSGIYTIVDIEKYSVRSFIAICTKEKRAESRSIEDVGKFDDRILTEKCFKILWHDFVHTDIIECLWHEYSIDWVYRIWKYNKNLNRTNTVSWPNKLGILILPRDLHDLDKPEYQETAKHLISLLS